MRGEVVDAEDCAVRETGHELFADREREHAAAPEQRRDVLGAELPGGLERAGEDDLREFRRRFVAKGRHGPDHARELRGPHLRPALADPDKQSFDQAPLSLQRCPRGSAQRRRLGSAGGAGAFRLGVPLGRERAASVSYTHLRAHETEADL
eukprot:3197853-Rhodomonas_salina.1